MVSTFISRMKKVFFFKYLLLYSTFATNQNGPTATEKSPATTISPSPDSPSLPIFTWTSPSSIHVTFPDLEEDTILLQPSNMGGILVKCLFDGIFHEEVNASAVVSGCIGHSMVYITIYSSHLQGRSFSVKENVTIEEINPYTNGEYRGSGNDYYQEYVHLDEDSSAKRVKRGTFEYYDGEEEYVDIPFDGPPPPIPSDLILKFRLGYDESLKNHMGGEDASRDYTVSVATHARLHMQHGSLGTKVHMQLTGVPTFAAGKTLDISRKSLTQVQGIKKNESIPLIVFCKTDDSSSTRMGIAWPGHKGGACNPMMGAALLKWRSNPALAAITFSHESGHISGMFHDYKEDIRNGYDQNGPCEGTGIMSDGSKYRPEQWSSCSSERLKIWYWNFGQCLQAPECEDGANWSTPCTYGTTVCLSPHAYCWKRNLNKTQYQCLSRFDIGESLQTSCGTQGSGSVKLLNGYPYLMTGSIWKPICGHFFWDNNNGASIFCKKLGYTLGGSVEKERKPYGKDAYYVGRCESGNITDLENSCTKYYPASVVPKCKKGNGISIKIICKGPTYVAYNNGPGCLDASISSSTECGIAGAFLGYSGQVQDMIDGNAPPGCLVGHSIDGWKFTYFNKHPTGKTARSIYRSVCHSGIRRWSEAQEKIWGDNECQHLRNLLGGLSLEKCKKNCIDTPSCTAINYEITACVLRGCTYPVPSPQWKHGDYRGYFIQDDEGEIPPNPKCATACEKSGRKKLDLICPVTEKINIKFALYGRLEASTCSTSGAYSTTCSASTAWPKVKELCDGKRTCSVDATNENFGDPCHGTEKYLSICYSCSDVIKQ